MHAHRESVWASSLVRRSTVKRLLLYLYKAVLQGLCLPSGQLSGSFLHIWPTLEPSPGVHGHTSAKIDPKVKASGRSKTHYGLELSSDFWLKEAFWPCLVSPLSFTQKGLYLSMLLSWLFPWGVNKRQRLVIYPVSVVIHFWGQMGGCL